MEHLKRNYEEWARAGELPLTSLFIAWWIKQKAIEMAGKGSMEAIGLHYQELLVTLRLQDRLRIAFEEDEALRRATVTGGVLLCWSDNGKKWPKDRSVSFNSPGPPLFYWDPASFDSDDPTLQANWIKAMKKGLATGEWDYHPGCGMVIPEEIGLELDGSISEPSISVQDGDPTARLPYGGMKSVQIERNNKENLEIVLTCS